MSRVVFAYAEDGRPLSWHFEHDPVSDRFLPVMVCPAGHPSVLRTHRVAANGTVSPSSVCPVDGCTFHEYACLDGWSSVKAARCPYTCPHGDRCTLEQGHDGGHNHLRCDCNEPDVPAVQS